MTGPPPLNSLDENINSDGEADSDILVKVINKPGDLRTDSYGNEFHSQS